MPKILANHINIYYELHGSRGEYLILIAGLTRDHTIWSGLIDQLSKTYRVLIWDNRGAGQSDKPDEKYFVPLMAADLSALMDVLHIKKASILGHSMGGFMAMYLAALHSDKVRKLIICSGCAVQSKNSIAYLNSRVALVTKKLQQQIIASGATEDDIKNAMQWIYSPQFRNDPTKVAAIVKRELNNPFPQPGYAFIHQAQACIEHDAQVILPNINAPTLILSGADDILMPPEVSDNLAKQIHGAKLEILPNAGHMLQLEQPAAFLEMVTGFLKNNDLSSENSGDEETVISKSHNRS